MHAKNTCYSEYLEKLWAGQKAIILYIFWKVVFTTEKGRVLIIRVAIIKDAYHFLYNF